MEHNKRLLQESHQIQNLKHGMRELVTVNGRTVADFFYNPFGNGSLLQQAVAFIVNDAFHQQPNTLANMSQMSRMLNEILDRELRMMGIIMEERFVFGSMNVEHRGGQMWVEARDPNTGALIKEYYRWDI